MAGLDFEVLMEASAVLFGAFGLVLSFLARGVDQWPRGLCVAILSSTIACAVMGLLEHAAEQGQVSPSVYEVMLLFAMPLSPLPSLLMFAYFLYCCEEDYRKSASMRILVAMAGMMVVARIAAQLTGEVGALPGDEVRIGPFSMLTAVLSILISLICLGALIRRWRRLTNMQRVMFLGCFLLPPFIQIIFVEVLLSSNLVQRYLAQQEEASRERTLIAVMQMRPHFIHNTLTSVYYLCAKDSRKAQQVIRDFSRYLQENFTAIAEEGTIPFTKELEHTRAYLAVEQVCHEGQLIVEFDTPYVLFRVPPLTLQPIVENAVKHGLDPDSEPLRVTVITRETESGVRIVVEDTGSGYAPVDDGQPHIALDNIRERLKTMCDGTLKIEAREGGGTRVTTFVPWERS